MVRRPTPISARLVSAWHLFTLGLLAATSTGTVLGVTLQASEQAKVQAIRWFSGSDVELGDCLRRERPTRLVLDKECSISDDGLRVLGHHPEIEELQMSGVKISGVGLQHVSALKSLKLLNVVGLPIGDEVMRIIKELPNLETLLLAQTRVTGAGLSQLADLKELTLLSLAESAITGAGLRQVADLKQVRSLSLARCAITDAGVRHLADLKQLRSLSLAHCAITDAGVRHLTDLSCLTELDLVGTLTGDASVELGARRFKLVHVRLRQPLGAEGAG